MSIKLTLLRSGESLIAETKELISQEDQLVPHSYLVENPHIVQVRQSEVVEENGDFKLDIMLSPWMVLSADKTIQGDNIISNLKSPLSSLTCC